MLNTIINGDALQALRSLPSDFVDLGITSPPYNKQEKHKGWLVKNVQYDNYKDVTPEDEYQQGQIDILNEIFRVTKAGGSFFYNHKTRWERGRMLHPMEWLLKTGWTIRQEIIWDRSIAANIRGWRFWQTDERIYWLYKPVDGNLIGAELASKDALLTSIWRIFPESKNLHPAPFPLTLPARIIISLLGERPGVILDPYAGSGTTLVAAKLLGKSYVGIEISPDYAAMAEERLQNAEPERPIVDAELARHKVNKTFKQRKEANEFTGRHRVTKSRPEAPQEEKGDETL